MTEAPTTEPPAPATHTSVPAVPLAPERQNGFSGEYVRDLREENKGWRLKAAEQETGRRKAEGEIEAAKAEAAAARAEVEERVKAVLADAERASRDRVIRAELRVAAVKAGMIDLDGLKLADLSGVKVDANGDVEGADALMAALKEAKPYLFGVAKSGTSSTETPPPRNTNEPKLAKDMTPAEREAFLRDHRKKFG